MEAAPYIAESLIAPLALLGLVWLADTREREPVGLVLAVFLLGAATAFAVVPLEGLLDDLFLSGLGPGTPYILASNFIAVALIEELVKLVAMAPAFKSREFDHAFDGVVYCVAASLGFAAMENIGYAASLGSAYLVERALFPVASHAAFGIIAGWGVGAAKYRLARGQRGAAARDAALGMGAAILAHGAYDSLLDLGYGAGSAVLLAFVACLYAAGIAITIARSGKRDAEIYPQEGPGE